MLASASIRFGSEKGKKKKKKKRTKKTTSFNNNRFNNIDKSSVKSMADRNARFYAVDLVRLEENQLCYSVTETVYRRRGQIVEIVYEYEEVRQEQIEDNMQIKHEKRARNYQSSIKRDEYERIARRLENQRSVLSFDSFVHVLRPFMMGTYAADEIHEAFRLLDRNSSKTIDLDEFLAFLPVIHPDISKEMLANYVTKVTNNLDQQLNFDEFNQLILRGIGRDIVCGHL